ncbi:hypothetical protein F4678DRAFT_469165 [Xylaria arbuscula]|nr:hypothetical protein F4678DRAFT_469165 [Xylaria arbuscula]
MPIVINKNIYTKLKIINKVKFTAPPLGILLQSTKTKNLIIPSLPPETVLIRPISHTVDPASSYFRFLSRKCTRWKLPVVPAFVLTNYKAQGKTFVKILLKLQKIRVTNGQPSKCNFTSLYIQLSKCKTLQSIKLLSLIQHQDFISNKLNQTIVDAMQKLRNLADKTKQIYKA